MLYCAGHGLQLDWHNDMVPAGSFKAFEIELLGEACSQSTYVVQGGTVWIDPTTMLTVRDDTLKRGGGKITEYGSLQLVSMTRGQRPGGS